MISQTRREFLAAGALAVAGWEIAEASAVSRSVNEKLNIAMIGEGTGTGTDVCATDPVMQGAG